MPETSVVIRAYNEEKYLPALLRAITGQTYRDFEVIVGDSGSFDRTRGIAQEYGAQVVRIAQRDFTFGHSLNVCVRHSNGRFIVIASAHTLPCDGNWLARMIEPLHDERIAMVYGRQIGSNDSKFGEIMDFDRLFGPAPRSCIPGHEFANNANAAVRRDLWERHPFDESLTGLEDIEWARFWGRAGYGVVYEPDAAILHFHNESWRQIRRRYYREAVAAKRMGLLTRQQVASMLAAETWYTLEDLAYAAKSHCLVSHGLEILRFRTEKTIGSVAGVWDGMAMDSPEGRARYLFNRTAKAVVIQAPRQAELAEVQLPPVKPGDVLIKVAYEGVCGTDLEILDGRLGYYASGLAKYPITPGHEFSGRVVEVGPNVAGLREGDRVVAECIQGCGECPKCRLGNGIACESRRELGVIGLNGGYAEYVVVPGHFVHHVPDGVSLQKAAMCEPLAVVMKGLKRLDQSTASPRVRRCLVTGAGPIGHLTALLLEQRGYDVVVFDRRETRLAYFSHTSIKTTREFTDLAAYDAIVDATGDPDLLTYVLHNSSAGTTLLLLGLPYARREFSFEAVVSYDKTIVGSVGSSAEDFRTALTLLDRIDLRHFLSRTVSLTEYQAAWQSFREGQSLKIQLAVDGTLDS